MWSSRPCAAFPVEQSGDPDSASADYRQVVQATQGYSDVYAEMDFATRDRYRHVVERIAKRSPLSEWEVAAQAVELARQPATEKGVRDRSAHVGYYLVDKGLPQLEAAAQTRTRLGRSFGAWRSGIRCRCIWDSIATITMVVAGHRVVRTPGGMEPDFGFCCRWPCWFCWVRPISAWPSSIGWRHYS